MEGRRFTHLAKNAFEAFVDAEPWYLERLPIEAESFDRSAADESIVRQAHRIRTYLDFFRIKSGRDVASMWSSWRQRESSTIQHIREGLDFALLRDTEERATNGLRLSLRYQSDEQTASIFGQRYWEAFNDAKFADHNWAHIRRVERWFESFYENIPALRHDPYAAEWFGSGMLAVNFHDIDQIMTIARNKTREQNGQPALNSKIGHGESAALMMLALANRYVRENILPRDQAYVSVIGASAMIARHSATGKSSVDGLEDAAYISDDEQLVQHYEEGRINFFTLSPAQLITIVRAKKSEHMAEEGTRWGLDPDFENEYAQELMALEHITNSLMAEGHLKPEQITGFRHAEQAFKVADKLDTLVPPQHRLFRTINTSAAKIRPFFIPANQQALYDQLNIIFGEKDVPAIHPSDCIRILYEIFHSMPQAYKHADIIVNSQYLQSVLTENIWQSLIELATFGEMIMKPSDPNDFSYVQEHYSRRIHAILQKAIERYGISLPLADHEILSDEETEEIMIQLIQQIRGQTDYEPLFTTKVKALQEERDGVINIIKAKRSADFSDRDYQEFLGMIKEVRHQLIRRNIRSHTKSPTGLPYNTYDSLPGPTSKIRTLRRPIGE